VYRSDLAARIGDGYFRIAYFIPCSKNTYFRRFKSNQQIAAALNFLKSLNPDSDELDGAVLDEECGVGVVVTDAELASAVAEVIEGARDELLTKRYLFPVPTLLYHFKEGRLKWASGKVRVSQSHSESHINQHTKPSTASSINLMLSLARTQLTA
jgi:hypothetical protein